MTFIYVDFGAVLSSVSMCGSKLLLFCSSDALCSALGGWREEGRRCGFVLLGTDGRTQGNRSELCMGGQEEVRKRLSYGEGVRQQSCAMPCTGR